MEATDLTCRTVQEVSFGRSERDIGSKDMATPWVRALAVDRLKQEGPTEIDQGKPRLGVRQPKE